MSRVIVVDAEKCYACLGCVVECALHRAGAHAEQPLSWDTLENASCDVVAVGTEPVPLVCQHCEDAPCLAVCPSGAITRNEETGAVSVRAELCIGCRACVMACPFGMIRVHRRTRTALKCDLCADRTSQGRLPACVTACPTGALQLKEVDDVIAQARKRTAAALRRLAGAE